MTWSTSTPRSASSSSMSRVGQPEAQIPADRQHDHVRREAEASKGGPRDWSRAPAAGSHAGSLAARRRSQRMQQRPAAPGVGGVEPGRPGLGDDLRAGGSYQGRRLECGCWLTTARNLVAERTRMINRLRWHVHDLDPELAPSVAAWPQRPHAPRSSPGPETAGSARVVAHPLATPDASTAVLTRCGLTRVATTADPDQGLDGDV